MLFLSSISILAIVAEPPKGNFTRRVGQERSVSLSRDVPELERATLPVYIVLLFLYV